VVSIEESRPYSKTKTWKLVDATVQEGGSGGILSSVADTVGSAVGSAVSKVKAAVGLS
jgi:hypothetical protein